MAKKYLKYPENLEGLDFVRICVIREMCDNCKLKKACPGQEPDKWEYCKHQDRIRITAEEKFFNRIIDGVDRPEGFR